MSPEQMAETIRESIAVKQAMLDNSLATIQQLCQHAVDCVVSGGTLFFCGNGGSFSDALHIVGELIGRYGYDRPGIPAVALGANPASMTAIGNDYGYEQVFKREIEALVRPGDVVVGLSTSGGSKNVIAALQAAKAKSATLLGMTGSKVNTPLDELCAQVLHVPSNVTPRIQECHILVGHLIAQAVEEARYPRQ